MSAYYNEIDPYAAQWLRNLIVARHIPPGDVDERSIADVSADDLRGYGQCHFFAGIGGWALALDLAGWPRDRQVWTGSCPCQPFSAAGAGRGFDDERHLWPVWNRLISKCRPAIIFGEQVAGPAVGPWLDLVQDDLEILGYAIGATAFPAASIGAPHIRDRTYWLGHAHDARLEGYAGDGCAAGWQGSGGPTSKAGISCGMANANGRYSSPKGIQRSGEYGQQSENSGSMQTDRTGPVNGHWSVADWLGCRDGKWRPVEPGTFPLAHGIPGRMGRLRAYGNAIVPQQAAEFIQSVMGIAP